jgi:hypothetical protein
MATLLLAIGLTSTAHAVIPISQNRGVTAFATATNPENFSHDADQAHATDFSLFIEGGFSEAFGQSLFGYNFNITTPTHITIYGELTALNEGSCHFSLIGPEFNISFSHFEEGTIPLFINEDLPVGGYQLTVHTNGFGQAAPDLDTEADGSITMEGFFSPVVAVPDASLEPAVRSAYPNPTRGMVMFELGSDAGAISIFDAGGRLVRSLEVAVGAGSVGWDGLDATGSRVAPGVYFYQASNAADRSAQRLIVLD